MEGNHEAIIPSEKFDMVQREMAKRGKGKKYHSGVHPFSSKIRCGECGSWYGSKVWHSTDKYRRIIWQCNHKFDGDKRCTTPHLTDEQVQDAFLSAANKLLATKDAVIANGLEMSRFANRLFLTRFRLFIILLFYEFFNLLQKNRHAAIFRSVPIAVYVLFYPLISIFWLANKHTPHGSIAPDGCQIISQSTENQPVRSRKQVDVLVPTI